MGPFQIILKPLQFCLDLLIIIMSYNLMNFKLIIIIIKYLLIILIIKHLILLMIHFNCCKFSNYTFIL